MVLHKQPASSPAPLQMQEATSLEDQARSMQWNDKQLPTAQQLSDHLHVSVDPLDALTLSGQFTSDQSASHFQTTISSYMVRVAMLPCKESTIAARTSASKAKT